MKSIFITLGFSISLFLLPFTGHSQVQIIKTIAGDGTASYTGDGGQATAATINSPGGVAFDASGNIYISDYLSNVIRKVSSTGIITTIAGTGTAGFSGDGLAATTAELNGPLKLFIDNSGNLYFADFHNQRIRKISTTGIITTVAGNGGTGYGGDGVAATATSLYGPSGEVIDNSGNLYIADYSNFRIRKVSTAGIISTIAGTGTPGSIGDGGPATAAELDGTFGIVLDNAGNLYLADAENNKVRKISTAGTITTIAGTGTGGYSGDGSAALTAELNNPAGISIDDSNNLFVADQFNNRIRKISASGTISTVVGNGIQGYYGDGGLAVNAEINYSNEVAVDHYSGRLYLADDQNSRVREMAPMSDAITIASNPLCVGDSDLVTDSVSGGTWSSSNTSVAEVGVSFPGEVVFGISAGTATISYILDSTTYATVVVTVNAAPNAGVINGASSVCVGSTISLTDTASGGVWSSLHTTIAIIGSSGIVTGEASGVDTVRYTVTNSCGTATAIKIVTVNATPGPILGTTSLCVGGVSNLSDATGGGTWSSSNGTVASIGSLTGIVSAVSTGTATITDRTTSGCIATIIVTVNPGPTPIIGILSVCKGLTISLTDATSGGTWASSNTTVATIGSLSAIVTGVNVGTSTITYASAGCYSTAIVTVVADPSVIDGIKTICLGGTTSLTDSVTGGSWSSSNTSVASVSSSGGIVTGNGTGTAIISYVLGSGCTVSTIVTVSPSASVINPGGAVSICLGGTTSLSDTSSGGTWSSSNTTIAGVGTSGIVTGNGIGTSTISYVLGSGCIATKTVTVNNAPVPISPASTMLCTGTTATLTDTTSGGVWSSSNTAKATVSGGIVTGIAAGTPTITYSVGTCYVTVIVTVIASPAAITPVPATVCLGSTTNLTDASAGGVWSSSATGTATVTGGVVTGNAVGTAIISYNINGCSAVTTVTVNNAPGAISPANASVCIGGTVTLSDATSGGVWSSGATGTATVSGNIVTGVAAGTVTISYTIGSCYTTTTVSVNSGPSAINPSGAVNICLSGTASLSDATGGGTWSSSSASVASVSSAGMVTGNAIGTANISYTLSTGCYTTKTVTVNNAPTAISPASPSVCTGSTITLTDAVSGGAWSSSATGTATVAGGIVTGIATGTAAISYAIGSCFTSTTITVDASPAAITPSPVTLCIGGTINLSDATSGGTWASSASGVASITSGGLVTANGIGTAIISYTSGGCFASIVITVNTAPGSISPSNPAVCVGNTVSLSDATTGGIWSSDEPAVATIAGGIVTGVAAGTASISYSIGYCSSSVIVTVNANPAAITPTPVTVCLGGTTDLTDATAGGTWSSSAAGIASVSGGVVTGGSVGTATIFYTISGCSVSTVATVNTAPGAISPANPTVCTGGTIILTDATTGGVWNSSATGTATVSGGVVSGITSGTATISYSIGTCASSVIVTVNATPSAISPTPVSLCIGGTITLTDATASGVWSSGTTSVASISGGGLLTALASGTSTILYTVGSCSAATVITVNATPTTLLPSNPVVCPGSAIGLFDAIGGGAWSSSATSIATISSTGIVTGITSGTTSITYAIGSCTTATTLTVNPAPLPINPAPAEVCQGGTITLTDATASGTWSSGTTSIATINAGGTLTGVAIGTSTIAYTNSSGCSATTVVTVTVLGTAGTIIGPLTICQGSFDIYLDYTAGGVWSLTNGDGVISSVGVVDAITAGADTVIYTITNVCGTVSTSKAISIVPSTTGAGTITGPSSACVGSSITLSDATAPGGDWSSTNGHATVGTSSGIVTGVSAGMDTIIYTFTTVCGTYTTSATVHVDATSTPSAISGPSAVCVGSNITLTDADGGGTWSSSNAHGTVIPGTGVVTGITPGLDTITYSTINGCGFGSITKTITITPAASAGTINGLSTVCPGSVIHLTDATGGGIWSASNGNATVNSTGHVTGVTGGIDTIMYTTTGTCGSSSATKTVTINPLPNAGTIFGPDSVCVGTTITLLEFTTGGTWTAGNSNATVSTTGIVTGISVGTDPISYAVTNSCGTTYATKIISVDEIANPGVITGVSNVCVGSSITLTDTAAGGIWLSSNGTAEILGPGIVAGVSPGIDSIFYVVINNCGTSEARKAINIHPVPVVAAVSGPTSQCVGTMITLTNATPGGDWSSSNSSIAAVNVTTGNVSGLSAGIATITYNVTNGFGCSTYATSPDTVNMTASVSPITGVSGICLGATVAFGDTSPGGTWTSSNTSIATVDASGNVTGTGTGVATISYGISGSCGTVYATYSLSVHPLPVISAITGTTDECTGTTTTLANGTGGGTWSSSNTSVATISSATGLVTGIAPGIVTITYWVTNGFGCSASVSIPDTVNALPTVSAISGVMNECIGSTATLTDATSGGAWSSSNTSVATIDPASGSIYGVSGGIVTISYIVTNASNCSSLATTSYAVNTTPSPSPITGATALCQGASATESDAVAGGVWSTTNSNASIDPATGIVTGLTAGTGIIIYTVANSCGAVMDSVTIVVNPIPVVMPITASYSTVCAGTSITLSDATTGGLWISLDTLVATINTSGTVTAVSTGIDTIMYALTNSSGCTGEAIYVLTIAPAISSVVVVPASATICHGTPVNMHTTTTPAGMTYQWLVNGNVIPGATNSDYIADSAGTYSLIVSNGSCTETIAGTVVSVAPHPVVSFTSPNILYTGSFYSYQWYKNGVAISGATGSVLDESGNGIYFVVVTDINGCSDTSSGYIISGGGGGGSTGISSTSSTGAIRIYPNPATTVLTIDAPVKVNAKVLGIDGRVIIEQKDATTIDVSILPNALYIIMVYDENDLLLMISKFIKTDQ